MKIIIKTCIYFSLAFFTQCSETLCGELDSESQNILDSARFKYKGLLNIENIPCDFNYINVFIKTDSINKAVLDSLHVILYDHKSRIGWTTIDIYDLHKDYKYSHGLKGNIYIRSGD